MMFEEKYFSCNILLPGPLPDQISWPDVMVDLTSWDINLIFLIKPLFLHQQKEKNLNTLKTRREVKIKEKAFFITFLGLLLRQIKQFFLKVRAGLYVKYNRNFNFDTYIDTKAASYTLNENYKKFFEKIQIEKSEFKKLHIIIRQNIHT